LNPVFNELFIVSNMGSLSRRPFDVMALVEGLTLVGG
jgi:hypothetical protein